MSENERERLYIVSDNASMRHEISELLEGTPYNVTHYADAPSFLAGLSQLDGGTVMIGSLDPELDQLSVLGEVMQVRRDFHAIVLVTPERIQVAVDSLKNGAADVLVWPAKRSSLTNALSSAKNMRNSAQGEASREQRNLFVSKRLTTREQEVLRLLLIGHSNKIVGLELGISERTVEVHRANIMRKLNVTNFAALIRLALEAGFGEA
jgi:two-component system, LuxR family, response regulator FixJ